MAGEVDFLGGTEMESGSDVGVRPLSFLNASSMFVCLGVQSSESVKLKLKVYLLWTKGWGFVDDGGKVVVDKQCGCILVFIGEEIEVMKKQVESE